MPQIAVDSKGNKIRWDESKKEWVPVEKAVDAKGTTLEFDGVNWNAPDGSKAVTTTKIVPPKPKTPAKDMYTGSVWSHGGKMYGPPDEPMRSFKDIGQAVGNAATGLLAYPISNIASHYLQTPKTGPGVTLPPDLAEQIGAEIGNKITIKATTPAAQAGAKSLAQPFAPFSLAIEEIPKAVFPIDEKASLEVQQRARENQAWARTTMGGLMLVLPYLKGLGKGFAEARVKSGQGVTPRELRTLIEKTPGIPKDVLKEAQKTLEDLHGLGMVDEAAILARKISDMQGVKPPSTRLESPPEPTGNPIADAKAQADFVSRQRASESSSLELSTLASQKHKVDGLLASGKITQKQYNNLIKTIESGLKSISDFRKNAGLPESSIPPLPGFTAAPPPGVTATPPPGVKVGEIPPVKVGAIPGINPSPAKILADALKQAPRVLPQQKSSYARESGERLGKAEEAGMEVGGEAGVNIALSKMKGKMKSVDFDMPDIGPENRASLVQLGWDSPYLKMGERFDYWNGLRGLLDEGKFPAKHEVEVMNRVLGNEVGDALIGKLSNKEQLAFWATNIANIPRTINASYDLSAPLRQGIWLVGRPKQFGQALVEMFRSLKSEEGYNASVKRMAEKPTFRLGRERGLALTEINSALNKTEEQFIGSGILERMGQKALKKWPDIRGKAANVFLATGIKASQRAYTGFLNKLRADTFDRMINTQKELGLYTDAKSGVTDIFSVNEKLSSDTARYVNIASGRGNLSGLAKDHAALTNAVFFSPRLMSARLALFDPRTYFDIARIPRKVLGGKKYPFTNIEIIGKESVPRVSKFVRQEAIMDAGRFFTFYTTSTALAKFVFGQDVGADPRNPDFTKIVSGNTSVDLSGGIGPYARTAFLLAQPLFKQLGILDEAYTVSSSSGKKTKMGGGFNEVSAGDVITRFLSQKENPVVSFFSNLLFQRDMTGKPFNVKKEITQRIVPILSQDLVELYKDDPDAFKMSVMGLLSMFGAGVQTYPPTDKKSFVDQGKKVRADMYSVGPTGDRVIDELNKVGVKAVLGTKKIDGQPVPEGDVPTVLKEAGAEIRKRVQMYLDSPAYKNLPEEKKKQLLQRAVNSGWAAYKSKKRMEKK